MDHMRISNIQPSYVIRIHTVNSKKTEIWCIKNSVSLKRNKTGIIRKIKLGNCPLKTKTRSTFNGFLVEVLSSLVMESSARCSVLTTDHNPLSRRLVFGSEFRRIYDHDIKILQIFEQCSFKRPEIKWSDSVLLKNPFIIWKKKQTKWQHKDANKTFNDRTAAGGHTRVD